MFIAIDGIEGSGKTTQAKLLEAHFGDSCIMVRDPGTTIIGEQIRAILLNPSNNMHVRTELMLFMAARAQMMAEIIQPALTQGLHVITDRFVSSTVAYQHGITTKEIYVIAGEALNHRLPDLTIILDLPVEVTKKRMGGKILDRFEQRPIEFHEECRNRFRNLATQFYTHMICLRTEDMSIEETHKKILETIESFTIQKKGKWNAI